MPSSSEEELDELLRRQVICQPKNFQNRRLFEIENPREFQEKFRLPVDAFVHLLELIGPRLEYRTRRSRALTARQQFLSISPFPWNKFLLSRNALLSWDLQINSMAHSSSRYSCNTKLEAGVHTMACWSASKYCR